MTTKTAVPAPAAPPTPTTKTLDEKQTSRADTRAGWLFCTPYLVLFVVFVIFPAVWGLWISLHRYDFTLPNKPFIGLDNYTSLINGSSPWASVFWEALRNTLLFTVLAAPLLLVVPLAVAMVLNREVRRQRNLFRAVYFAPYVLGMAVIAVLWRYLLDTNVGSSTTTWACDPLAHQPAVGVDLHRRGDRVVDVGLQLRHSTSPRCRRCRAACTRRLRWTGRASGSRSGT